MAGQALPPKPKVMTWGKAAPVLALTGLLDALRFIFEWFVLVGPVLVGSLIAAEASRILPSGIATLVGGAAGIASGAFGWAVFAGIGIVMSIVVGIAGWILSLLVLAATNFRIFKRDLWHMPGLLLGVIVTETPFVGAFPAITVTIWRMYRVQIHKEKKLLKHWEKQVAAQKRQQQEAQMQQALALQAAEANANAEAELEAERAADAQAEQERSLQDQYDELGFTDTAAMEEQLRNESLGSGRKPLVAAPSIIPAEAAKVA